MDPSRDPATIKNPQKLDPLYVEETASRKRVWESHVRLDEENRRNPRSRPSAREIRQPLSIVHVERDAKSNYSELVELSYSADEYRSWLCTFCGKNVGDHSWSSFDHEDATPRFRPLHCTLHKLLDRMAQDLFHGCKVSLDTERSHLHDVIKLIFEELDELSTVISTTHVELLKEMPETPSFPAMDVDQQLKSLKKWLHTCQNGDNEEIHEQCQMKSDLTIPAKRVLNLSDAANGVVQLVEAANCKGSYVALSHCWGDVERHPLTTTHATLEQHLSGIAVSSLPSSFRDAIRICLFLEIKYIWIDCLCIVQDDSAEWLAEADKMAEIYQESYLTIAGTRARNSQHGFLFDFPDDTIHYAIVTEAQWDTDSELRTFHVNFRINHVDSKRDSAPLDRRAWCLQEWYLPKRLVEFCLNDVRLVCLRYVETRFGRKMDEKLKTRTIVRGFGLSDEPFFRNLWENIRSDFFGRRLTKSSDMLPALAGLAKMLEKMLRGMTDHKYLAGLWTTRISEDLSWTVLDFDATTGLIEGLPTWSWASITSPSDYIYLRPFETFIEVEEARCQGYARPKPASLKVKGFIASLFLRVDHRHKGYQGRPSLSFWFKDYFAVVATTEEVETAAKENKTNDFFVLDMPIVPAPHSHDTARQTNNSFLHQVPAIVRAPQGQTGCSLCMAKGYVAPVQLLLLTRTDSSLTALVLTPVLPRATAADPVYQRLGLLEVDSIRNFPWIKTADGLEKPADAFWTWKDPATRKTITLV